MIESVFFWILTGVYILILLYEVRENYINDLKGRKEEESPGFIMWSLSRHYYYSGLKATENLKYKKAVLQFKRSLHFDRGYLLAYVELGKALKATGKIQTSLTMFEKAITLNDNNLTAHLNLGIILFEQGKYREALEYFEKAYSIDKDNIEVLLNRASCLFELRQINASIENYLQAFEKVNDEETFSFMMKKLALVFDCVLYKVIANFFDKLNIKYEEISYSDTFDRSFEGIYHNDKKSDFTPIEQASILMMCFPAGECANLMQKFSSVFIKKLAEIIASLADITFEDKKKVFKVFFEITDWEQIIKVESEEAKRYYNLGKSFLERDNLELARTEFRKALRIEPSCVEARRELGLAFARSGLIDEAIMEWEKTVSMGIKDAEIHKKLGDAYAKKGNLIKASKEWKRAAALDRDRSNDEVR